MVKLTFSGHESFHCRSIWLNKGYNFVKDGYTFLQNDAVVELGVGKNMVSSINYWLHVFRLSDINGKPTKLAEFIFGENGVDPNLEDLTSLWLLHYHLVTENIASIYSIVFNEFRKQQVEFNKNQLLKFIAHKCSDSQTIFNKNTGARDITVFLRNYVKPSKANKNLEEIFSGLFIDLQLIEPIKKFDEDDFQWYKIENKERKDIPCELVLYAILANNNYGKTIPLDELQFGYNSVGNTFALDSKGLLEKISELTFKFKNITFSDSAGIRQLQISKQFDGLSILRKYYDEK